MIDVAVLLPLAREKEKMEKTDLVVGSQNGQEIDLCVCVCSACSHVHRWICVLFISAVKFLQADVRKITVKTDGFYWLAHHQDSWLVGDVSVLFYTGVIVL